MKNFKVNKGLKIRIISGGLGLVLVASGFVLGKSNFKKNALPESTNITIVRDSDSDKNDSTELINTAIVSDDELESVGSDEFVNQSTGEYIEKQDDVLEEVDTNLLEEKENIQNVETFNIENLIVMENINENNESDLYVLHVTNYGGTCYEYCMENINGNNESDLHILNVPSGDGTCYEFCNEFKTWFGLYLDIDEGIYDVWPGYIYCKNCQPLFNYLTDEEIDSVANNGGKITKLGLDEVLARIRTEYQRKTSEKNYTRSLTNS